MLWPPRIERFYPIVIQEADGLPPNLVLAIIQRESGGTIGRVAGATTKPWTIPTVDGSITFNRALGLMQVVPRTIDSYNRRHPNKPAYYEQMSGKTLQDARIQIRVGCDILQHEIETLNKYDPLSFLYSTARGIDTNQLLMALLAYRMGFGSLRKKMERLRELGKTLTFENIKSEFPKWGYNAQTGKWVNRPIYYVEKIWGAALEHGMTPGTTPPADDSEPPAATPPDDTFALGALAIVAIGLLLLGLRK